MGKHDERKAREKQEKHQVQESLKWSREKS